MLKNGLIFCLAFSAMSGYSQSFQASIGPQMAIGFNEFAKYDAKPGIGFGLEGAYVLKSSLSFTAGVNHLSFQTVNGTERGPVKFTSGQIGIRYGGFPGEFYGAAAMGFCLLGGDFITRSPQFAPSVGMGYLLKVKQHFVDVGLRYNNISLNDRQWSSIALKLAFGFQFGKPSLREPSRADMKRSW